MKQDECQQQTQSETLEQQKSNNWTSVGPTKDRSSGPSQVNCKLYAEAGTCWHLTRLDSRDSQWRRSNIDVVLLVFLYKLVTYLAAIRWVITSFCVA